MRLLRKHKKGFTLIELLAVIAIIGLLASIVSVALTAARQKTRTAVRISEMNEIQKALELYFATNGLYPDTGGNWRSECSPWRSYASDQVAPGLVPTYMPKFPAEPSMGTDPEPHSYCYIYMSNGTDYALLDYAILENTQADYRAYPSYVDPTRDNGPDACTVEPGGFVWAWKIYSPGGKCW